MSKRIQYAQSLPVLPAAPPAELGRVVVYAKKTGLFIRLADGTEYALVPSNASTTSSFARTMLFGGGM